MISEELQGIGAGLLTGCCFLPQVALTLRSRNVEGLSLTWLVLMCVASVTWGTYGLRRSDWPVALTNGAVLVLVLVLTVAKIVYGRESRGRPA